MPKTKKTSKKIEPKETTKPKRKVQLRLPTLPSGDILRIWDEDHYSYSIGWYLAEEGDKGGCLGEDLEALPYSDAKIQAADIEDKVHFLANNEAFRLFNKANEAAGDNPCYLTRPSMGGFCWETFKDAERDFRIIKLAVLEGLSKKEPLADWEKKAVDAGWTPPAGRL